jgi:hypothetical protein
MTKIVCIDNTQRHNYLTFNKTYLTDTVDVKKGYGKHNYKVKCDDGKIRWELRKRFVTIQQKRDDKINLLLEITT